nr:structural protein [Tolivirales sp.]
MSKRAGAPVQGGVRKRRTKMPMLTGSGDASVVRYSTLGSNVGTGAVVAGTIYERAYVPGSTGGIVNGSGPSLTAYYSTGKFMPGTSVRWEPAVSFTTSGRVVVGFTDNPEIMHSLITAKANYEAAPSTALYNIYLNSVKSLGSVRAFPVWQETQVPFPTRLRRKRFDINFSSAGSNVDNLDRSAQTYMAVALEGVPLSTTFGSFHYHDVIDVEGITGLST